MNLYFNYIALLHLLCYIECNKNEIHDVHAVAGQSILLPCSISSSSLPSSSSSSSPLSLSSGKKSNKKKSNAIRVHNDVTSIVVWLDYNNNVVSINQNLYFGKYLQIVNKTINDVNKNYLYYDLKKSIIDVKNNTVDFKVESHQHLPNKSNNDEEILLNGLHITYLSHPYHVGIWSCLIQSNPPATKRFNISLLVPPPKLKPSLWSSEIDEAGDQNDDLITVTCSGHYALPAVELKWIKVFGPDVKFETLPPRYLTSKTGLHSVSLRLIFNKKISQRIVFECQSSHMTSDDVLSSRYEYLSDDDDDDDVDQAGKIAGLPLINDKENLESSRVQLGSPDVAIILIFIFFIIICAVVTFVLIKFKHKWMWKKRKEYSRNATKATLDEENLHRSNSREKVNSHFVLKNKIICGLSLAAIFLLILSFPVYIKSLTVPKLTNVDQLLTITAGSALLLDCTDLFLNKKLRSLTWIHNNKIFYQQFRQSSHVNDSENERIVPIHSGQMLIWPTTLEDEGVFVCQVDLQDQSNFTYTKNKRLAVIFSTGSATNGELLVILTIVLLLSIGIFLITLHNAIKQLIF